MASLEQSMIKPAKIVCSMCGPPLLLAVFSLSAQAGSAIDAQRSQITVHVGKSGVFGAGHEHDVRAPIASGTITTSDNAMVEFKIRAADMKVLPEAKVSVKDHEQIQQNMQEHVLESGKFPEIEFRSSKISKTAANEWKVTGTLRLHGTAKLIQLPVELRGDAYTGSVKIKQTDFGITPIKVAGGLVRVRDELAIEFRIYSEN
jgi:polyisoprenoid-binding protein YceI